MRYGSMVWLFDFLDFIMQLCYSFNWVVLPNYTYNFLIELLKNQVDLVVEINKFIYTDK